ncbi:MAG: type 4a pilus biogenesis protein PilO [Bdellovibrionota bacterium]
MIKEILGKIPWTPLFLAYVGLLGWNLYQSMNDLASPYQMKLAEIQAARNEVESLQRRVQEVRKFIKEVEVRQTLIQKKMQELEKVKNVIPEKIDISEVNVLITTEAAKSRVQISKREFGVLTPSESGLYAEMPISLTTSGVFQQYVGFFQRLASAQRIIRVEGVTFTPLTSQNARFVTLEGKITLKIYKYQGSQADRIAIPPEPSFLEKNRDNNKPQGGV